MNTLRACLAAGLISGVTPFLCAAELSNDAVIAAMNVGRAGNYSWVSVHQFRLASGQANGRKVTFQGQTDVRGYTRLTVDAGERSAISGLGGDLIGNRLEAVFQGSEHGVVATERGWMTFSELPNPEAERLQQRSLEQQRTKLMRNATGTGDDRLTTGRAVDDPGLGFRMPGRAARPGPELTIHTPHEDMQMIVIGSSDYQKTDTGFSGRLSDAAIQYFSSVFGISNNEIVHGEGTYRCWVEGKLVTKYEITLNMDLTVPGGRSLPFIQTWQTEIRDVGRTEVQIPEEARTRLAELIQ